MIPLISDTLRRKSNFIINDIELYVPPTAISIHKENLEYSFKTLRNKVSTKVASGNGTIHIQIDLLFSHQHLLELHRLICQMNNIPLVYIQNKFIVTSLGIEDFEEKSHFTVFSFAVSNHPSSAGSMLCQLDLRFFNNKPYTNKIRYHFQNPFENMTFNPNFNEEKYIELPKQRIPNYSVQSPKDSLEYIRYSNYLQTKSLLENFGFNITKNDSVVDTELDFGARTLKMPKKAYDEIINATAYASAYKGHMPHDFQNNYTSFKRAYNAIMLESMLLTSLHSRYFIKSNYTAQQNRELRKILNNGITKTMSLAEKQKLRYSNYKQFINGQLKVKQKNANNNKGKLEKLGFRIEKTEELYSITFPANKVIKRLSEENSHTTISVSSQNNQHLFNIKVNKLKKSIKDNYIFKKGTILLSSSLDDIQFPTSTSKDKQEKDPTQLKAQVFKKIQDLKKDNYFAYLEIPNVNDIYRRVDTLPFPNYDGDSLNIKRLTGFDVGTQNETRDIDAVISSVSGAIRHIVSSIPIIGQPYPTHQFLGSIEPVYNFSFIANKGSQEIENLENIVYRASYMPRKFMVIPDAGNVLVESFITKLFGSFKQTSLEPVQTPTEIRLSSKMNFSINSSETFTIEGSPNSSGMNVRFSESNSYDKETLSQVTTTENNTSNYLEETVSILKNSKSIFKPYKYVRKKPPTSKYDNWQIGQYTDLSYFKNNQGAAPSKEHNINAYFICELLHNFETWLKSQDIKDTDGNVRTDIEDITVHLTSPYSKGPDATRSTSVSNHYLASAADIKIEGITALEGIFFLLNYIEYDYEDPIVDYANSNYSYPMNPNNKRTGTNKIGLGLYGSKITEQLTIYEDNSLSESTKPYVLINKDYRMDPNKPKIGFIHIDLNLLGENKKHEESKYKPIGFKPKKRRWIGQEEKYNFTFPGQTNTNSFTEFWTSYYSKISNSLKQIYTNNQNSNQNDFSTDNPDVESADTSASLTPTTKSRSSDFKKVEFKVTEVPLTKPQFKKKLSQRYNFNNNQLNSLYVEYYAKNTAEFNLNPTVYFNPIDIIDKKRNVFSGKPHISTFSIKLPAGIQEVEPLKITFNNYSSKSMTNLALKNKDLLEAFQQLASSILIEPSLYLDKQEIEQELIFIKKELYGLDIVPFHFNIVNKLMGEEAVNVWASTKVSDIVLNSGFAGAATAAAASYGAGLTASLTFGFVPGVGQLLLLLAFVAGALYSIYELISNLSNFFGKDNSEIRTYIMYSFFDSFKKNQKDYFEVLKSIYRDYEHQQNSNQNTIDDYKENSRSYFDKEVYQSAIQDFYEKIGENNTLEEAISIFIETIFPSFPAFEKYRQLVTGMKISNNLRSSIVEKKKDKYELIGLSEEITGSALREYLTYIFSIKATGELDEVFETEKDNSDKIQGLSPILSKPQTFKDNTFLKQFNNKSSKLNLPNRLKNIFKESQKIRIVFLKDMLKRILDEFIDLNKDQLLDKYSNKTIANAIDNRSVFQLLETNAYPDIILPPDPKLSTFNSNLHPVFFMVDNNEFVLKDKNLRNLIKSYELQDTNKILNNSINFMEAMRDPKQIIFSGTYEDFIRTRDFDQKFLDKYKDVITDSHELGANSSFSGDTLTSNIRDVEDRELVLKQAASNILPDAVSNLTNPKAIENITKDLKTQVQQLKNLEDIFGSKYGYLNKKYSDKNGKQIEDTSINIKTLTKDAVKNITSLKTMKNAFPTFRFYLVEEDEIYSDRFTAFDDFFSFNSVISFDYYTDKSMPAATAHIRLQNVSGILDGTKKDTLRDIDYSANSRESSIEAIRKNDQLVDSVVLRPGISVQLRAGFDSNTNNLDILLSGKIIEINYANNNTICNLTLQSFGFELEAKRKGVQSKSNQRDRFGSTHQLLSAMLLSPELKHFGRIKTGAEFQTFETREPSLDLRKYLIKDEFNFAYTRSVFDFIGDNYYAATLALLAAPTLLRKVGGAAVKKIGELLSKIKNPSVTTSLQNVKQFTSAAVANSKGFLNKITDHTFTGSGKINHLYNLLYNVISIPLKSIRLSYNSVTNIFYNTRGGVTQAAINVLSPTNQYLRSIKSPHLSFVRGRLKDLVPSLRGASEDIINVRLTNILGYKRAAQLGIDINAVPFFQYEGYLKRAGELAFKGIGTVALEPLALAGTLSIVPLVLDVYSEGINLLGALFSSYQKQKRRLTTRILLSPQDDNVFPPNPSSYLTDETTHSSFWDKLLFNNVQALYKKIFSEKDPNILQTKELLYDKRLSTSPELLENEYILTGQTTWKVLKDMCLRHPGWVCGLRPYGNSLEYRVFFGVPSQRHFSKQIKYSDLKFLKDMEKIIFKDPNKVKDKVAVLKENINSDNLDELVGEFKHYLNKHHSDLTEPQEKKAKVNQLIDLYLSKTEDRFTPYRKYHSITSENDIIANNIILSSHNVVNSVDVHFKKYSEDNTGFNTSIETLTMNSLKYITRENRKPIVVNEPNVTGIRAAYRYGLATLLEGAKNMYEGSLLILGNTKINTHDIVVLRDEINNMFGVLEVKSVTHMFSHERGFITELGVNAVTTANEGVTYPQLYELFKYLARRKLYMQYSNYASFNSNRQGIKEDLKELIEDEVEYIADENPNVDEDIDNEILEDIVNSIFDQIDTNKENDVPSFIEDVTSNLGNSKFSPAVLGIPESQLEQYLNFIAIGLTTTGATSNLVAKLETNVLKNMGVKLFSKLSPRISSFLFFGGISLYALKSFGIEGLNESYRSGIFGKQYFQSSIFATVEGQNLVQIYPLMRGGVPLLAGGYEHVSNKQIWNNVYGNIYNNMSNSLEGYFERQKELSALGELAYYNYIKPSEDFSLNFRFQKAASDLFGGDSSDTEYTVLGYFMED